MKAYTDYPFMELEDKDNEVSPIRECEVISYDGDKYCMVIIDGIELEVKAGYLYKTKGRFGEVDTVNTRDI